MITLVAVNKALAERGVKERLFKGKGYFFFAEGNAHTWYQSAVYCFRLNELTLSAWLEQWKTLSGKEFPK